MYIFRLGIVATLLSETLVNAFTCACAFQVVAEQIKDLLGIKLPKIRTTFKLPYVSTFIRFFVDLQLNAHFIRPQSTLTGINRIHS